MALALPNVRGNLGGPRIPVGFLGSLGFRSGGVSGASGVSGETEIPGACLISGELHAAASQDFQKFPQVFQDFQKILEAFQDFQKFLGPGVWTCGVSGGRRVEASGVNRGDASHRSPENGVSLVSGVYRGQGTSLIRNTPTVGPYSSPVPRDLW